MNEKVLWTIGDSIFHINRDMACTIASNVNCTSITSDFSGASISPCRIVEQCMVNLIKDGTFDKLFAGGILPDVILVQRGVNDLYEYDVNGATEMGEPTSTDETKTLLGAVNFCIKYFKRKFESAKLIWCTPMWSAATSESAFEEYREKLCKLCALRGVTLLDVYEKAGIGKENQAEYLYDGTHPNSNGKKKLTEVFSDALREEI